MERERQSRDLTEIAREAMIERDLRPDFPPDAIAEAESLPDGLAASGSSSETEGVRDLRRLPWFSIDNDDTRDLDQLTTAEREGEAIRLRVAVADVDELVPKGSAIDDHARHNTVSVYTAARTFPMIPERLSTGLTSLNEGEDRFAVVAEMLVDEEGSVVSAEIYRARVHNHAKLAYNSLAEWLEGAPEGETPLPEPARRVPGLDAQIRLHDEAAGRLRRRRHERGALELDRGNLQAVLSDGTVHLQEDRPNRAKELIEDFMIATNGVVASWLEERGLPSLRRVVRSPYRWPRIVEIAAELGERLPAEPSPGALSAFLRRRREAEPDSFPELSLAVLKLLGSGEYSVDLPGQSAPSHFGLAAEDYTHATAPNRRYPDLVTQRMIKAVLAGRPVPYEAAELEELARHCTKKEDDARKVERQVRKSAAALVLEERVGDVFEAAVTGASEKGTWVRTCKLRIEGRLTRAPRDLDVGHRLRVRLKSVNVERGFIDFVPLS